MTNKIKFRRFVLEIGEHIFLYTSKFKNYKLKKKYWEL